MENGWQLLVRRLGIQQFGSLKRTYGTYEVYRGGRSVGDLAGNVCECPGPGENRVPGTSMRIEQGRYPLWTQFGPRYRTVGYTTEVAVPGEVPMPALLLGNTGNRAAILIHPGHPDPRNPNSLYLSSIGCLNLTGPLRSNQAMDFLNSRARVIALIQSLMSCASPVFGTEEIKPYSGRMDSNRGRAAEICCRTRPSLREG